MANSQRSTPESGEPYRRTDRKEIIHTFSSVVFSGIAILIMVALAVLVYIYPPEQIIQQNNSQSGSTISYLLVLAPAIFLFFAAVIAVVAAQNSLDASNPSAPDIMPPHDRKDLIARIVAGDKNSVSQYIRLRNLRGITGFFHKIELQGLPLATIFLTIIFTIMAILSDSESSSALFDLAKLTLGAFIGSYVQRKQSSAEDDQTSARN